MTHSIIKVAIADDHLVLADGLQRIVNDMEGYKVIYTAGNGKILQEYMAQGLVPDILILDLNMPVLDGFATAEWMRLHHPHCCLLILSMNEAENAMVRLLRLGVKGFLTKDAAPQEFRTALQAMAAGGTYYYHGMALRMANLLGNGEANAAVPKPEALTDKEIMLLKLCCEELPYKEIGARLGISLSGVDNLREKLFIKLQVKSRTGLAIYAIRTGLVVL